MLGYRYYYIFFIIILFTYSCSPKFNWRAVSGFNNEWEILFPAKPIKEKRVINLEIKKENYNLEITRHTCKVNQTTFLVESVKLASTEDKLLSLRDIQTFLKENLIAINYVQM